MSVKRMGLGRWMQMIALSFVICHLSFGVSACSESEDEETGEFANWQARNEAYFASLEDSLSRGGAAWKKIKSFTKDETSAGAATDYIYAHVLEQGSGDASPMYTDSVRVAYRGRLIPTANYTEGYVFDQTYLGSFNWKTLAVSNGLTSGWYDGFTTALLHMHKGDHWLIYLPYELTSVGSSSTIPAHSVLIFDIALVDFCHPSESLPKWSSRQR